MLYQNIRHVAAGGTHAVAHLLERELKATPAVAVGEVEVPPVLVWVRGRRDEVVMELLQSWDVGWVDTLGGVSWS